MIITEIDDDYRIDKLYIDILPSDIKYDYIVTFEGNDINTFYESLTTHTGNTSKGYVISRKFISWLDEHNIDYFIPHSKSIVMFFKTINDITPFKLKWQNIN